MSSPSPARLLAVAGVLVVAIHQGPLGCLVVEASRGQGDIAEPGEKEGGQAWHVRM